MSKAARNIGLFRRTYAEVNVGRLEERFEAGATVTPEALVEQRLMRSARDGVRILGDGALTKAITVRAHHFTAAARAKIEAAGGTAEVI